MESGSVLATSGRAGIPETPRADSYRQSATYRERVCRRAIVADAISNLDCRVVTANMVIGYIRAHKPDAIHEITMSVVSRALIHFEDKGALRKMSKRFYRVLDGFELEGWLLS